MSNNAASNGGNAMKRAAQKHIKRCLGTIASKLDDKYWAEADTEKLADKNLVIFMIKTQAPKGVLTAKEYFTYDMLDSIGEKDIDNFIKYGIEAINKRIKSEAT